ncbi:hypothetical protein CGRA01v4_11767 [Colletotrichum graminicola]|nr:hypothetical protein CGRA01v4_11767 [Colletotrichum graminicola]
MVFRQSRYNAIESLGNRGWPAHFCVSIQPKAEAYMARRRRLVSVSRTAACTRYLYRRASDRLRDITRCIGLSCFWCLSETSEERRSCDCGFRACLATYPYTPTPPPQSTS